MRDDQIHRNSWPVAIIEEVYPSEDNRVRKVQVRVGKDRKRYVRPICQIISLLSV